MKMTREEAIRNFREHWASLAISGSEDKNEFLRRHNYPSMLNDCFLCEFTMTDVGCDRCPVEWEKTRRMGITPCTQSFYGDWVYSTTPEERKRLAAIIRDLPEKKVETESELKIGDWVKIVSIGGCHSSYETFFKENNLKEFADKFKKYCSPIVGDFYRIVAIGKYHGESEACYGPLYVIESCDGQAYIVNNDKKGMELITSLKPRFSVGDRVRVKSNGRVGTIKGIQDKWPPYIGVEFDEPIFNGHNFNDHLPKGKDGHCYFYNEGQLELLPINYCPEDKTVTVQTITIEFKGPKTICTIENQFGTFKGRAKCHPTDQWNEKTGADLALERAVEKFNEYQPDA